jgi:ubiquinone/menaquinone biosynthesis C-methylase UbiE
MGFYDRHILPRLIGAACAQPDIDAQRRKVVPHAEGVVLELGFGTGLNLPHYDPTKVTRLYALEPAEGMLSRARHAAQASPVPIDILPEPAERLSLPERSIDTVVTTYCLCTIPDVAAALGGARRALKPGGRLLFCEHGLAPDPKVARWQRRIEPFWKPIAGGCHLARDIRGLITAAGFRIERVDAGYRPNSPRWAGFDMLGAATPE